MAAAVSAGKKRVMVTAKSMRRYGRETGRRTTLGNLAVDSESNQICIKARAHAAHSEWRKAG